MSLSYPIKYSKTALCVMLFLVVALAMSCGSGGSESSGAAESANSQEKSELYVSLTDAEGDFLTYTVDVLGIQLKKSDGSFVEALPSSSSIDFADYTDMTEFMTVASIPLGSYSAMTLRLDYSKADIQVEMNGVSKSARVQDSNGQALSTLDVEVKFTDRNRLVMSRGVPSHMVLDFDLKATHQVDLNGVTPVVTVRPTLIADISPTHLKDTRVRGWLSEVKLQELNFRLNIQPLQARDGRFGDVTVNVDESTEYEIEGLAFKGSTGLRRLAELPPRTFVVAYGDIDIVSRSFIASVIHAGIDGDGLRGSVIARTGDLLTVIGGKVHRGKDGRPSFDDRIQVDVSELQRVCKQSNPDGVYTKEDIYVGAYIFASGNMAVAHSDNTLAKFVAKKVHIHLSNISGEVLGTGNSRVLMNLQGVNLRRASLFDIANQDQYVAHTSTLNLREIGVGSDIKMRGFFEADGFHATSMGNISRDPRVDDRRDALKERLRNEIRRRGRVQSSAQDGTRSTNSAPAGTVKNP